MTEEPSSKDSVFTLIDEAVRSELSEELLSKLCEQLTKAEVQNDDLVRLGRARVQRSILPSGRVIVGRAYRRGGFPAYVVQQWFFHIPILGVMRARPVREFRLLQRLRSEGLRVPLPLAVCVEFSLRGYFYRGFLFTEEVENSQNLLQVGVASLEKREDSARFLNGCYLAGVEAKKMLRAGVFHRDLHPGNVLLTNDEQVVLLDFDKALESKGADSRVGDPGKLVMRWERSVEKHRLNYGACTEFSRGLFEGRKG